MNCKIGNRVILARRPNRQYGSRGKDTASFNYGAQNRGAIRIHQGNHMPCVMLSARGRSATRRAHWLWAVGAGVRFRRLSSVVHPICTRAEAVLNHMALTKRGCRKN